MSHHCQDECCGHDHAADAAAQMEEEFMGEDEKVELNVDINLTPDGGVSKKVIRAGSGPKPPRGADVNVHYVGRLLDNTVFDSSRDRGTPFTFKLGEGQVIKGWDTGVATMRKGELAYLTCKPEYAYGERAQGKIPSNSTLVFEVELLSFVDEKDLSPDHDGGIMKKVLKEGEGYEMPSDGSVVQIVYTAALKSNGQVFDQAGEDKPLSFTIGDEEVPLGLDKGAESMKKGEKSLITASAKYAYGPKGDSAKGVPADSEILYTVTMVSFTKPKMPYQMTAEEILEGAEKKRLEGNSLYTAGRVKLAEKRYKKAIEYLDADYKLNEEQKVTAKKAKVPCYLNVAACMIQLKDFKGAIENSNKALEIESKNVKGLVRRGKAKSALDEWEEAEKDLNAALEVDPANVDAKREMALLKKKIAEEDAKNKKKFAGLFGKLSKLEEEDQKRMEKEQALLEKLKKEEEEAEKKKKEAAEKKDEAPAAPEKQ